MKVFYIAEITGKAGIWLTKKTLPEIRKKYEPDFIIANANSSTASSGLGKQHAAYLKKLGVNCITLGDNAFHRSDLIPAYKTLNYILRPVNLSDNSPGHGAKNFFVKSNGKKIAVISALGTFGIHRIAGDNPFIKLQNVAKSLKDETPFIVVDFASFSTAEKQICGLFLDGMVSAVLGSGTKVPTADECVLNDGTGFITDAGRTGDFMSVSGFLPENKIREYKTGLPEFAVDSWVQLALQGVFLELDDNGKTLNIERVFIKNNGSDRASS